MDARTLESLSRALENKTLAIRAALERAELDARGSTFLRFVDEHLKALEQLVLDTKSAFCSADDESKKIAYGRKLLHLLYILNYFHKELFEYLSDVGRRDLSPGLLYLIDSTIRDLLQANADPLIHLDSDNMYSTQRLIDRWAQHSEYLNVEWEDPVEPIILFLPGIDPQNALLSPILVHEVGHSAVTERKLIKRLAQAIGRDVQSERWTIPLPEDKNDAQKFAAWAEELLCDALATELTGPSFVFSAAVFLPAASAGRAGDEHPDPAQRIKLALYQLNSNGWLCKLEERCPAICNWLRNIADTLPENDAPPEDEILRNMVDASLKHIVQIASECVTDRLTWEVYESRSQQLEELLSAAIPPAELEGEPVPPWHLVAATWLHNVDRSSQRDDVPRLTATVHDEDLSKFVVKAIEMSQVLELWRNDDAPST